MSRHESVSCDSCLKGNFRGKRYKCLICYDYDLCATCYEAGATTTRHTTDHPMQCILTRTDFDLFYGGEALTAEQPQSFSCPYCGKMGYTEITLQEHVTSEHSESSAEVVCPICAALPGGDPNHVTDEFAAHLTLEHRAPRDFDEPMGGIRHVRRIPHPSRGGVGGHPRTRRTANMQFQSSGGSSGSALSGLSPSSRDTMDPIAELLSQLSSVRSRAQAAQSVSSQLQQLEMQLQSTRSSETLFNVSRQQLERLPRRQQASAESSKPQAANYVQPSAMLDFAGAVASAAVTSASSRVNVDSQYLLARVGEAELSESERSGAEVEHADRSLYIQELLLSSLSEGLRLSDNDSDASSTSSNHSSTTGGGGAVSDTDVELNSTGLGGPSAAGAIVLESLEQHSTSSSPVNNSPATSGSSSPSSTPRDNCVQAAVPNVVKQPAGQRKVKLHLAGGAEPGTAANNVSDKEPPPPPFPVVNEH